MEWCTGPRRTAPYRDPGPVLASVHDLGNRVLSRWCLAGGVDASGAQLPLGERPTRLPGHRHRTLTTRGRPATSGEAGIWAQGPLAGGQRLSRAPRSTRLRHLSKEHVPEAGLDPATSTLGPSCSVQLSYSGSCGAKPASAGRAGPRWAPTPRPPPYRGGALPAELHGHCVLLAPAKGFEPQQPDPKSGALSIELRRQMLRGRASRARTGDPVTPSHVRYQTAPPPDRRQETGSGLDGT